MPPVLNVTRLGIWQGCEYARVILGFECVKKPEHALICLNILEQIELLI